MLPLVVVIVLACTAWPLTFFLFVVQPHIVPFFFGNKGTYTLKGVALFSFFTVKLIVQRFVIFFSGNVGRPSRWSSGTQESSWRGGFLLAALEMYLKNDMKAKFVFLNDVEAAVGFTSTLLTQEFVGTTTIVPQVSIWDYFRVSIFSSFVFRVGIAKLASLTFLQLFRDPTLDELYHYFQRGAVAAYEHVAMIKVHYSIADELDECVRRLESGGKKVHVRRRSGFVDLPKCRKPPKVEKKEAFTAPPSILSFVMGSGGELPSVDCEDTLDDSTKEDEYSRDWVDLD